MEWKTNAQKRERRELKSVKFDYCHQYKVVWNEDVETHVHKPFNEKTVLVKT